MDAAAASALLKPAPYRVIDDFLGDDLVARLLGFAVAHETHFRAAGVGRNRVIDPSFRAVRHLRELGAMKEELAARFAAVKDWTIGELRSAPFELMRLEIELLAYGDGGFYKRHIDTALNENVEPTERVLSGVYYFHALPRQFTGGALRLHPFTNAEPGTFIDVEPVCDRLLLFPAWAPHEVLPVACPSGAFCDSRFAINCWYRRSRVGLTPSG